MRKLFTFVSLSKVETILTIVICCRLHTGCVQNLTIRSLSSEDKGGQSDERNRLPREHKGRLLHIVCGDANIRMFLKVVFVTKYNTQWHKT